LRGNAGVGKSFRPEFNELLDDLFPLAVLSPAGLFLLWHDATPGRAAVRGFLYGLGLFGFREVRTTAGIVAGVIEVATVATLGVLGWRLVNFWLPNPAGAIAYVSLKVPRGSGLQAMRAAVSTSEKVATMMLLMSPCSLAERARRIARIW
jgi:hypothetical protein